MTLKELRERQIKLVADARAIRDQITADTDEARAAELETQHDAAMAEYDRLEARAEKEEALEARAARLAEVDTSRRPNSEDTRAAPVSQQSDAELRAAAFRSYLRSGLDDMPREQRAILRELRAQSVGTDSAGGYTVPTGFLAELITALKAWGPMLDPGITRELVTASGNQIEIPTMDDTANQAYRLAENTQETHSDGDLAFGQKVLDAYKYASGAILVSAELLQDSAFDIEAEIREAMAIRFGRKVNSDLTVGDGSGDPNGIVTASTAGKTAASATTVTFDELIDLQHAIDPAYRGSPTCRWMFNDGSLKVLRKLKDGQSNYLWQPADVRTGAPSTILGFGYVVNQAMPSMTTGQKSVLFGDFRKYVVRRVREVAVRRLNERYADFDQVGFLGFARFDGELLDTAAVKHLVQA
jgi:HK97 family phage major capsid protein